MTMVNSKVVVGDHFSWPVSLRRDRSEASKLQTCQQRAGLADGTARMDSAIDQRRARCHAPIGRGTADVADRLYLTTHAVRRQQQRGISHEMQALVQAYGDQFHDRFGAAVYWLGDRAIDSNRDEIRRVFDRQTVDRSRNVALIVSGSSVVSMQHVSRPKRGWTPC
jgi:hypothetical protein